MVDKYLYFYQTVLRKQTVVFLIPLFKNSFNPFALPAIIGGSPNPNICLRKEQTKQ
jgi:hypothetical protein